MARGVDAVLARQAQLLELLGYCIFVVAYYAAYRYGMAFSQAAASPFWFPDSVLLCALLRTQPSRWPLLILATLPIRLFADVAVGIPTWFLAACFAIDSAKGLVTALALRAWMTNPVRFDTLRDFGVFCAFAVVLVPAAFAFLGAGARAALGDDYWLAFEQWFLGDALTHLIVTPFIFYWVFGARWWSLAENSRPTLEALGVGAAIIATCALSYFVAANSSVYFRELTLYAPVPLMFWAAIRFGMMGAAGAIAAAAFVAVGAAIERSTFADLTPSDTAFALQNFLLLRALPVYLVAALLERSKTAERALRESEVRFRDVANTTPALLWMTDPMGVCAFVNQTYESFSGRKAEELLGEGWADIVHPDDRGQIREAWAPAFAARERFENELRFRRHDGAWRWMLCIGVPRYASGGEFLGYVGSVVDITDRKRADEMVGAMGHVQRLATMGELTIAFAHEVKQPLAAILTNAGAAMHLLESGRPSAAQEIREALVDIRSDDLRANEIIERVRQFGHRSERRMEPMNLNATVVETLRLIKSDARRRNVHIHTDLATGLPLVNGDRAQLQQVLLNLFVNGMDAMAAMDNNARHLTVRTRLGARGAEILVIDSGEGVAAENLPSLFDSFFTTKGAGTGLGLAVARSIVVAHHGEIKVENNDAGGATFFVSLPFAEGSTTAH